MKTKYLRAIRWADFYKLIPKDQLWQLWKLKKTAGVVALEHKPTKVGSKLAGLGVFLQNFVKTRLKLAK